ncbi:hypothetical protein LCGC14_2788800 [marine sediment metagenome]|uniref:Ribosomal protein L9 domain-containing protein n=1 Tax=marine sediment metagenome TaxID=412755 RepID=A0A0F9BHL4_9ZZZZ
MKILLRRNVRKLGQIGDVVEVRDGYARNYLIPCGLATVPSEGNIKAIEREKLAYLAEQARLRQELETQANILDGKEFTITVRANEEGHLYGSVGPAQIAQAVGQKGIMLDVENIVLDEPIRKLDKYEVVVAFDEGIQATITLWVVPPREADSEYTDVEAEDAPDAGDADSGESEPEAKAQLDEQS